MNFSIYFVPGLKTIETFIFLTEATTSRTMTKAQVLGTASTLNIYTGQCFNGWIVGHSVLSALLRLLAFISGAKRYLEPSHLN